MNNREPLLFSNGTLGLFAAIALIALYYAFPGERLLAGFKSKPVDIASLAYLRAAFNHHPDDLGARFQLAEKLFEISQIQEAESMLIPLVAASSPSLEIREMSVKIKFRRYFELKDIQQKQALQAQLKTEVNALFPQISRIEALDELADLAYQLGEPLVAANIYRHIIELQSPPQPKRVDVISWLGINSAYAEPNPQVIQHYIGKQLQALQAGHAGGEALGWAARYVQEYPQAPVILARAIEIAQSQNDALHARDWGRLLYAANKAGDGAQEATLPCQADMRTEQTRWACQNKHLSDQKISLKSAAFINLVKHFQFMNAPLEQQLQRELAANQLQNSLQWFQQQLALKRNAKEILPYAILIAQKQGATALAKQWNAKLLDMQPENIKLLKQQIDFEMTMPNLPQAMVYAQKWQQLAPADQQAHLKLANLAQWAGKTEIALDEWFWLFNHTGQTQYVPEIVSLATARYKFQPVVNLYAQLGRKRPLTETEVSTWMDVIQKSGLEDAGSGMLQAYLSQRPRQQSVWAALVDALDNSDRTDAAIATLQTMEKHFRPTAGLRLKQVDLMVKLGRVNEAWQLLLASKTLAKPEDQDFWKQYANIAFMVGAENDFVTAYKENAAIGEENATLNYYFLNSIKTTANNADFEQYAFKIWEKSHDLPVLLDLIQFKMQHDQWAKAKSLLGLAPSGAQKTANAVQYWLLKAEIAQHFDDRATVNTALHKALALAPDSAAARSSLLWHLVATADKPALRTLLAESARLAQAQSSLWESMAVGYRFLGEPKQALPWYAKALKQWPGRNALVLEYAQLLQEAGEAENAKKIWRYLLNKLPVNGLAAAVSSETPVRAAVLERRYGEMLRLYMGVNVSEQWLRWMQQHQDKPTGEFSEYRIAWFLAQQRNAQAQALAADKTKLGAPLPHWQKLALATESNDVKTIAQLMRQPTQLMPLDKVNALRAVGEEQQALVLATQLLGTVQDEQVTAALRQQVADLSKTYPQGWALGAKANNVSELDILSYSGEVAYSKNQHIFGINYRDQFYGASKDTLHLQDNQRNEHALNLEWKYHALCYETKLKVGVNLRDDKDFATVDTGIDYLLSPGWKVQLSAGYNTVSAESATFRVAGLKDLLALRLSGEFSKREYFSLYAQGKHFKTRGGESVGFGYGGGAEVGYRIWLDKPEWVVALYGNWNQASLDAQLPEEWRNLVSADLGMNRVISSAYKEVGLDLRLKEGDLKPFGYTARSFRYYLEGGLFLGQPTGHLGTKVSGGVGTRLFSDDEISLSGLYSSVQGGAQSLPSLSVELRYSRRF